MSPKRYFVNNLSDYNSSVGVKFPKDIKKRCLYYIKEILNQETQTSDGGLYVGLPGFCYLFYYLSKHPSFCDRSKEFLEQSVTFLRFALNFEERPNVKNDPVLRSAFLLGSAGLHVVAAVITKAAGNDTDYKKHLDKYTSLAAVCSRQNFLKCGSDELLMGRAGYLSGVLFLQKELQIQVLSDETIFELCAVAVKSGTEYSAKVKSPCPLMFSYYNTEYLGAAHGLSGILQMLLGFPKYLDENPDAEMKIKESVDFLLRNQTPAGNFPSAMDEVDVPRPVEDELVHWCHGAPGVVYLMAKAYLRWKEEKYLASCLACGELVWKKGLLKKGPGICHGVAGSGYVFLLLYRLTRDDKHLHRAIQFGEFLFSEEFKSARTPDEPFSLYEGLAGTVCFLADLLDTENAHFPFFDVF